MIREEGDADLKHVLLQITDGTIGDYYSKGNNVSVMAIAST